MKLPFRHGKAEPRNEPIAAMIKRVADEHRLRAGVGPGLTPASVLGEAARPRSAGPGDPTPQVGAVSAPAPAPSPAAAARALPDRAAADLAESGPARATTPPPVPAPSPIPTSATVGEGLVFATCGRGHRFVRLADHPAVDGIAACPHCMAKTLGDYRKIFAAIVRPVKYE